jgi:hypothetical protein
MDAVAGDSEKSVIARGVTGVCSLKIVNGGFETPETRFETAMAERRGATAKWVTPPIM